MAKLFFDTSFIIPIFKRNDTNRRIIQKNKKILLENDRYISNGILEEVITVIMMRTKSIEITKKRLLLTFVFVMLPDSSTYTYTILLLLRYGFYRVLIVMLKRPFESVKK